MISRLLHGRNVALGAMACCVALALALGRNQARASEPARLLRQRAEPSTRHHGGPLEPVRGLAARLTAQSDEVVLGRVRAVAAQGSGPRGEAGIHSRVSIEVDAEFRGRGPRTLDVWVQGGELNHRRRVLSGQARFRTGEALLLFLRARPDGVLVPAGRERGKWTWLPERDAVQSPDGVSVPLAELSDVLEGVR